MVSEADYLIRSRLCESIRNRCPSHSSFAQLKHNNAAAFRKHLKALSKPFRLFDLPMEVRNSIYELALPLRQANHWKYPPLLHTSSQIRQEACPLFHAKAEFVFIYLNRGTSLEEQKQQKKRIMERLAYWVQNIARDNAKHVLKITISHPLEKDMHLRLEEDVGLTVSFSLNMWTHVTGFQTGFDMNRKVKHVQSINKAFEITGMKNQSLLLVLTSSTTLWKID